MSYCRWSSYNWKCDIYAYEGEDGFITHVARNRIVGEVPNIPYTLDIEDFTKAYQVQIAFLETAQREPIGLPYDGQTFTDGDLQCFLVRLLCLKTCGYNVPDWVIANVREEMKEEPYPTILSEFLP